MHFPTAFVAVIAGSVSVQAFSVGGALRVLKRQDAQAPQNGTHPHGGPGQCDAQFLEHFCNATAAEHHPPRQDNATESPSATCQAQLNTTHASVCSQASSNATLACETLKTGFATLNSTGCLPKGPHGGPGHEHGDHHPSGPPPSGTPPSGPPPSGPALSVSATPTATPLGKRDDIAATATATETHKRKHHDGTHSGTWTGTHTKHPHTGTPPAGMPSGGHHHHPSSGDQEQPSGSPSGPQPTDAPANNDRLRRRFFG